MISSPARLRRRSWLIDRATFVKLAETVIISVSLLTVRWLPLSPRHRWLECILVTTLGMLLVVTVTWIRLDAL
jgi:hypothetical protein